MEPDNRVGRYFKNKLGWLPGPCFNVARETYRFFHRFPTPAEFPRRTRELAGLILHPEPQVELHLPTESHGSFYGGWALCPRGLGPESIVYSFGIGQDVTFDLSLIARYGLTVYGFDPTPPSIRWVRSQSLTAKFIFFEYGIAGHDGTAQFYEPEDWADPSYHMRSDAPKAGASVTAEVHRLEEIMRRLRHSRVDVMKMDVEGAEYEVIEDLARSKVRPGQLLVEFHGRFKHVGQAKTRRALRLLRRMGYRIVHISKLGWEFSFIAAAESNVGMNRPQAVS